MDFPCDGKKKTWPLTAGQVAEWQEAFPTLDVLAECRKARAWINAAPANRKTASGMARFLVKWLARSQNGRPQPAAGVPPGNGRPRRGETAADVFAARRRKQGGGE